MVDDNDRRYEERREEAGPNGRVGRIDHARWSDFMEEAKETRAEVVCAWCGTHLGFKDVVVPEGLPAVTHGICDDCKAEARKEE